MLEARELTKTFNPGTPNEVRALQGASFELAEGSFTVIIGGNGSGKSSILNAIAGTFQVDDGCITLDGRDITRWSESRRAQLVGRVFQNPFSGTAPDMSIAENLALAAQRGRRRGLRWALPRRLGAEMRDRVRPLNMGLEDRLDTPIGSLSGGQRQALTLLMATWVRPRLLLLDEHTAALDPKSADQVIELTAEIIESQGLTALMVTHSMHQAANLGDRLVMVNRGQILHDFSGAEKRRLKVPDLLDLFDEVRRMEQLDESTARMLKAAYV